MEAESTVSPVDDDTEEESERTWKTSCSNAKPGVKRTFEHIPTLPKSGNGTQDKTPNDRKKAESEPLDDNFDMEMNIEEMTNVPTYDERETSEETPEDRSSDTVPEGKEHSKLDTPAKKPKAEEAVGNCESHVMQVDDDKPELYTSKRMLEHNEESNNDALGKHVEAEEMTEIGRFESRVDTERASNCTSSDKIQKEAQDMSSYAHDKTQDKFVPDDSCVNSVKTTAGAGDCLVRITETDNQANSSSAVSGVFDRHHGNAYGELLDGASRKDADRRCRPSVGVSSNKFKEKASVPDMAISNTTVGETKTSRDEDNTPTKQQLNNISAKDPNESSLHEEVTFSGNAIFSPSEDAKNQQLENVSKSPAEDEDSRTMDDEKSSYVDDANSRDSQIAEDESNRYVEDEDSKTTEDEKNRCVEDEDSKTTEDEKNRCVEDEYSKTMEGESNRYMEDEDSKTTEDEKNEYMEDEDSKTTEDEENKYVKDEDSKSTEGENNIHMEDEDSKRTEDEKNRCVKYEDSKTMVDENNRYMEDEDSKTTEDEQNKYVEDDETHTLEEKENMLAPNEGNPSSGHDDTTQVIPDNTLVEEAEGVSPAYPALTHGSELSSPGDCNDKSRHTAVDVEHLDNGDTCLAPTTSTDASCSVPQNPSFAKSPGSGLHAPQINHLENLIQSQSDRPTALVSSPERLSSVSQQSQPKTADLSVNISQLEMEDIVEIYDRGVMACGDKQVRVHFGDLNLNGIEKVYYNQQPVLVYPVTGETYRATGRTGEKTESTIKSNGADNIVDEISLDPAFHKAHPTAVKTFRYMDKLQHLKTHKHAQEISLELVQRQKTKIEKNLNQILEAGGTSEEIKNLMTLQMDLKKDVSHIKATIVDQAQKVFKCEKKLRHLEEDFWLKKLINRKETAGSEDAGDGHSAVVETCASPLPESGDVKETSPVAPPQIKRPSQTYVTPEKTNLSKVPESSVEPPCQTTALRPDRPISRIPVPVKSVLGENHCLTPTSMVPKFSIIGPTPRYPVTCVTTVSDPQPSTSYGHNRRQLTSTASALLCLFEQTPGNWRALLHEYGPSGKKGAVQPLSVSDKNSTAIRRFHPQRKPSSQSLAHLLNCTQSSLSHPDAIQQASLTVLDSQIRPLREQAQGALKEIQNKEKEEWKKKTTEHSGKATKNAASKEKGGIRLRIGGKLVYPLANKKKLGSHSWSVEQRGDKQFPEFEERGAGKNVSFDICSFSNREPCQEKGCEMSSESLLPQALFPEPMEWTDPGYMKQQQELLNYYKMISNNNVNHSSTTRQDQYQRTAKSPETQHPILNSFWNLTKNDVAEKHDTTSTPKTPTGLVQRPSAGENDSNINLQKRKKGLNQCRRQIVLKLQQGKRRDSDTAVTNTGVSTTCHGDEGNADPANKENSLSSTPQPEEKHVDKSLDQNGRDDLITKQRVSRKREANPVIHESDGEPPEKKAAPISVPLKKRKLSEQINMDVSDKDLGKPPNKKPNMVLSEVKYNEQQKDASDKDLRSSPEKKSSTISTDATVSESVYEIITDDDSDTEKKYNEQQKDASKKDLHSSPEKKSSTVPTDETVSESVYEIITDDDSDTENKYNEQQKDASKKDLHSSPQKKSSTIPTDTTVSESVYEIITDDDSDTEKKYNEQQKDASKKDLHSSPQKKSSTVPTDTTVSESVYEIITDDDSDTEKKYNEQQKDASNKGLRSSPKQKSSTVPTDPTVIESSIITDNDSDTEMKLIIDEQHQDDPPSAVDMCASQQDGLDLVVIETAEVVMEYSPQPSPHPTPPSLSELLDDATFNHKVRALSKNKCEISASEEILASLRILLQNKPDTMSQLDDKETEKLAKIIKEKHIHRLNMHYKMKPEPTHVELEKIAAKEGIQLAAVEEWFLDRRLTERALDIEKRRQMEAEEIFLLQIQEATRRSLEDMGNETRQGKGSNPHAGTATPAAVAVATETHDLPQEPSSRKSWWDQRSDDSSSKQTGWNKSASSRKAASLGGEPGTSMNSERAKRAENGEASATQSPSEAVRENNVHVLKQPRGKSGETKADESKTKGTMTSDTQPPAEKKVNLEMKISDNSGSDAPSSDFNKLEYWQKENLQLIWETCANLTEERMKEASESLSLPLDTVRNWFARTASEKRRTEQARGRTPNQDSARCKSSSAYDDALQEIEFSWKLKEGEALLADSKELLKKTAGNVRGDGGAGIGNEAGSESDIDFDYSVDVECNFERSSDDTEAYLSSSPSEKGQEVFKPWQTEILNRHLKKNPKPTETELKNIAGETKLPKVFVKEWFSMQDGLAWSEECALAEAIKLSLQDT